MNGAVDDEVVTAGDPRLKAATRAVASPAELAALLSRMTDRLRALNGAGLAAPQLGVPARVVVVEVRKTDVFPDRPVSPLIQMVDPEILESSHEDEFGWEGCFSVPGFMGMVPRATAVRVGYSSAEGERVEREFNGYVARVVQHEIDHLHGIEFVERMQSMSSFTTVANYLRFHR